MLGWHWLAQVQEADPDALSSPSVIRDLLRSLATELGLRIVSPPVLRHVDGGIAGVVLLAESHAAVHTQAAHGVAYVDVFSCVPIEAVDVAEAVVREHLGGTVVQGRVEPRHADPQRTTSTTP